MADVIITEKEWKVFLKMKKWYRKIAKVQKQIDKNKRIMAAPMWDQIAYYMTNKGETNE